MMFSSTFHKNIKLSMNIPRQHNMHPTAYFSDHDIDQLSKYHQYTLVGKFYETQPSLDDICDSIKKIGMHGDLTVGFVDKNHVLIRCCIDSDFQSLWMKGSWKISGIMIKVFKWNSSFNPQAENITARFWVNLPKLKLQFFNHDAIERIGNSLGTYLRTDSSTFDGSRPCLARMYVEMDISKELPDKIWIGNEYSGYWQNIEYSNVPPYCRICFTLGHKNKCCSMVSEYGFVKHVKGMQCEDELCFVCTDSAFRSKSDMKGKRKWIEIEDEDEYNCGLDDVHLNLASCGKKTKKVSDIYLQTMKSTGAGHNNNEEDDINSDEEITQSEDGCMSKRNKAKKRKVVNKTVTNCSPTKDCDHQSL